MFGPIVFYLRRSIGDGEPNHHDLSLTGCWVVGVRPGWSAINIARLPGSLTETGEYAGFFRRRFIPDSTEIRRIRFGAKRLDFMVMADAR
jgi:hypothetical protein